MEQHRDWNQFGFICLIQSWPQLHCNDFIVATTGLVRVQALRRNGHCSSATAVSSCTKGYHAENLPCNTRRQGWHSDSLRPSELKCQTLRCESIITYTKHREIHKFVSAVYAGYSTLSTEQNGGHFADDIYTLFPSVNIFIQIYLDIFHYSLVKRIQHWLRQWLNAE